MKFNHALFIVSAVAALFTWTPPASAGIFDGCLQGLSRCEDYAALRPIDRTPIVLRMCEEAYNGCRAAAAEAYTGRGGFQDVWIFPGGAIVYIYPGGQSVLAWGRVRRP